MPIFRLDERIVFPPPELAEPDGLLAVGGDLRPRRLLTAYAMGIFPWYSEGQPILWHSPDPRFVLEASHAHVPRSLEKRMRRGEYEIRFDTAFTDVVQACARVPRPGQRGTWITSDMREAYAAMHRLGHAHSVEVYDGERLVGGLYGMAVGRMFFGESMFSAESGASKVALASLARALHDWGWPLLDAQVDNDHLQRLGVELWPRSRFQQAIAPLVCADEPRGPWTDRFGECAARALASTAIHTSG